MDTILIDTTTYQYTCWEMIVEKQSSPMIFFFQSFFSYLLQYVGDCYRIVIFYCKRFLTLQTIILTATISILMLEVLPFWFHLEGMAASFLYVAGKLFWQLSCINFSPNMLWISALHHPSLTPINKRLWRSPKHTTHLILFLFFFKLSSPFYFLLLS